MRRRTERPELQEVQRRLMSVDYSSFGLQDKIAIVTGASQGIGRAIAVGLAQAGRHMRAREAPGGPPRRDRSR